MGTRPAEERPTTRSIAAYLNANAARVRRAQQMRHGESVITREAHYKDHHIVVRTMYEVEVDGKPIIGHLGVNDAGLVHYHPLPNLRFASALDMVKKIIDVFPEDFGPDVRPEPMPPMNDGSHARSARVQKKQTKHRLARAREARARGKR